MATIGTSSNIFVTKENAAMRGKSNTIIQKRAALQEVGNKVTHQKAAVKPQELKKQPGLTVAVGNGKPVNKQPPAQTRQTGAAPANGKALVVKKQPTIQVKDTKACRLRGQYNRLSYDKNSLPASSLLSVPEIPRAQLTKIVEAQVKSKNAQCTTVVETESKHAETESKTVTTESKPVQEIKADLCVQKQTDSRQHTGAFSNVLLGSTTTDEDIDKEEENNPLLLGLYANDMFMYLREMEVKFPIVKNHLKNSKVTSKMRATLIDWLVEVNKEFEMTCESLYLSIAILDRFLQVRPDITKLELQLVGATATYVAAKYEEMVIPDVVELVYISDNAFTRKEVLKMELDMVRTLDCSFGRPLPIHFLRRYSRAESVRPLEHVMAKYVLEVSLLEYDLCHERPSLLAAAALYISLWLLDRRTKVWTSRLVKYSMYEEFEVLPTVKKLAAAVLEMDKSKYQCVRKKYANAKAFQVSVLPELKNLGQLLE